MEPIIKRGIKLPETVLRAIYTLIQVEISDFDYCAIPKNPEEYLLFHQICVLKKRNYKILNAISDYKKNKNNDYLSVDLTTKEVRFPQKFENKIDKLLFYNFLTSFLILNNKLQIKRIEVDKNRILKMYNTFPKLKVVMNLLTFNPFLVNELFSRLREDVYIKDLLNYGVRPQFIYNMLKFCHQMRFINTITFQFLYSDFGDEVNIN